MASGILPDVTVGFQPPGKGVQWCLVPAEHSKLPGLDGYAFRRAGCLALRQTEMSAATARGRAVFLTASLTLWGGGAPGGQGVGLTAQLATLTPLDVQLRHGVGQSCLEQGRLFIVHLLSQPGFGSLARLFDLRFVNVVRRDGHVG